jgi:hypothetical protein
MGSTVFFYFNPERSPASAGLSPGAWLYPKISGIFKLYGDVSAQAEAKKGGFTAVLF